MAPPRILRIITRLNISGPAIQAVTLTARLRDKGYDCLLVCGGIPEGEDSVIPIAESYGIDPIIVPSLHRTMNPLNNLYNLWQLYQIIRREKPDIVHTHTTTAGFLGRLAARLAGVPVTVHTLHFHPFRGYYNRPTTLLFIWMERLGARLSDSIITLSTGLRRELTETYHVTDKKRITVLPLGLDLDVFARPAEPGPGFRDAHNIPPDAPLIGIVGRLVPVKNHELFLEAAARIARAAPDVMFVIVGDGALNQSLQEQARELEIEDRVIFTGWQKNMPQVYQSLDALVISSQNEGTPVPLIEALVAGCPVVATAVGGIPDLLDGGKLGRLVPSGDASALGLAILDTISQDYDPIPARTAMQARYGLDRLVDDLDSLYRGLISSKQRNQRESGPT